MGKRKRSGVPRETASVRKCKNTKEQGLENDRRLLDSKSLSIGKKKRLVKNDDIVTSTCISSKMTRTGCTDGEVKEESLVHQNPGTALAPGKNTKTNKKKENKIRDASMKQNDSEANLSDGPEKENLIRSNVLDHCVGIENKLLEKDSDGTRKDFPDKDDPTEEERTIYVGNLPLTYDKKKVIKLFAQFGNVQKARIRCVPVPNVGFSKKRAAITRTFHPQRNSVAAYVVFKLEESVLKAVSKNGMIIDNHHLRIDRIVPQGKDINKSVFVGGLPFDIEDDELWDFFKDCGDINSVRVVRDRNISMGKGFGYVNFTSTASVELALQLNGRQLKNRAINVERCIRKKKNRLMRPLAMRKEKKNHKKGKKKGFTSKAGDSNNSALCNFQGIKCEQKQKKKKRKLTKEALRKHKVVSLLAAPTSRNAKGKDGS